MATLSKKQVRVLERQISKLYGRSYFPNVDLGNNISLGDVLISTDSPVPEVDGSVVGYKDGDDVEGNRISININTDSEGSINFKAAGKVDPANKFSEAEAGLSVNISKADEMFIKILNGFQKTIKSLPKLAKAIQDTLTREHLSKKVYVVTSIIQCDQFYVQYGASKEGEILLSINVPASGSFEANGNFHLKKATNVGYSIDGTATGGVLGFRVHKIILNSSINSNKSIIGKDNVILEDATEEFISENLQLDIQN